MSLLEKIERLVAQIEATKELSYGWAPKMPPPNDRDRSLAFEYLEYLHVEGLLPDDAAAHPLGGIAFTTTRNGKTVIMRVQSTELVLLAYGDQVEPIDSKTDEKIMAYLGIKERE